MVSTVCCSQSAPKLLVHVSLLLAIISGAGLATLARLKWDPSTYLIFREFLPTEYHVLSGVLCFGSILLIVLAHLALLALSIRRGSYQHVRQAMFFTYSVMMTALIIVELVTIGWLSTRFIKWLQTDEAKFLIEAVMKLKSWDSSIFEFFEIASVLIKPLRKIVESMNEVKEDLPYNLYVGIVFVSLVAILQPTAVLLAWNAAFTYTRRKGSHEDSTKVVHTIRYNSNGKKPVETATNKEKEFQQMNDYLSAIKNKV